MKQHLGILTVLLVTLVSLSLVACDNLPSNNSSDSRGPQDPVGPQGGAGPEGNVGPEGIDGSPENVTQIEDSGHVVHQEYDFTSFEKLEVSDGFDVELTQGDTFSVVLHVEENLVDYVRVTQAGNTLSIGLDPDNAYHMENITALAEVTMPMLSSLVLDLSGDVTVHGFETSAPLTIVMSLSSSLCGEIVAGDLSLDVAMGGEVNLGGSAQRVTVVAAGGSEVNLADFMVVDADIHANESSTVTVNPSGSLDAYASGNAAVFYLGNPKLGTVQATSGGSIQPG